MTFYDGYLYAAVNADRIALIDIDNPPNSIIIIDEDIPGDVFGIVSFAEDCSQVDSYAITNGDSDIYKIDFTSNTLNFICQLDIEIGGGASTFEFLASDPLAIQDIQESNPSCDLDNGSIIVESTGGFGQIYYSIESANFQTSGIFENLPEGLYTVFIRDDYGCVITEDVELSSLGLLEISAVVIDNTSCGFINGSITVFANEDAGQVEYSIDGSNFQNSNVFFDLSPGLYMITVKTGTNCMDEMEVSILSEESPEIEDVSHENAVCGLSDGSLTVLASGGTGQLVYSIDGLNYQLSNIFNDLDPDDYTVYVQDNNTCIDFEEVEILGNAPYIDSVSSENVLCGMLNGSLTVFAEGGVGPLEYSIDGDVFQQSNVFEYLDASNYTIIIQDIHGCTDTTYAEILADEPVVIENFTLENATCGNANGSITIVTNRDNEPLEYTIDGTNFQADSTFNNLLSGNYTIMVRDTNNCTDTQNVDLPSEEAPEIEDITLMNTSCGFTNGSITIITNGGTGVIAYSIDGINYQTSNFFGNLSSGILNVSIRDENNCTDSEMLEIPSTQNPSITLVQKKPTTCNQNNGEMEVEGSEGIPPFHYSVDGDNYQDSGVFENLSGGSYTVIVKDLNDCIDSLSVIIEDLEPVSISTIDITDTSCGEENGSVTVYASHDEEIEYSLGGINFQSSNIFTNLAGGSYLFLVRDSNGCQDSQTINIETNELPQLSVEAQPTQCGKSNGSIIFLDSGGSEFVDFSINGMDYQSNNVFEDLAAGDYVASVKNEKDCISLMDVHIFNSSELSFASVESTPAHCEESNGSITLEIEGGTGQVHVSFNDANLESNHAFNNLAAGEYTIHIVDESNCVLDTVVIVEAKGCGIYVPNVFSPNNDGINDVFKIFPHSNFKGEFQELKIFSRWGELVHEYKSMDANDHGWDGTLQGRDLEMGVYAYYLLYTSEEQESILKTGDLTIVR